MTNPFDPLMPTGSPAETLMSADFTDESQPASAEPQRPPKPPMPGVAADAANAVLSAVLRDGDPRGDSLPRADGAPTRD